MIDDLNKIKTKRLTESISDVIDKLDDLSIFQAIDNILHVFTNKDYINSIGTNSNACLIEKNDCNLNIYFLFYSFSKEGFSSI